MRILSFDINSSLCYDMGGNFISFSNWKHFKREILNFELIYVTKGCLCISSNNTPYHLKQGEFLLIYPNELHFGTEKNTEELNFFWLHFSIKKNYTIYNSIEAIPKELINGKETLFIPEHFVSVEQDITKILFKHLMNYIIQYDSPNICLNISSLDILANLSMQFLSSEKLYDAKKINAKIVEIQKIILCHLDAPMSIKELAQKFGYNEKYFIEMFKKNTGITPKQYLISSQLLRAKQLLSTTNLYVKEIAQQVGFKDEKAFSKFFKVKELITPSEYRKKMHGTPYNSK